MIDITSSPNNWSVQRLVAAYRQRTISPVEVMHRCIEVAEETRSMNAFAAIEPELALSRAREVEALYQTGALTGPLAGVPVGVKDLFGTDEFRTKCGSKVTGRGFPWRDAKVIALLRAAGAIVLGKTTTHEFGWGITTYSEHFGATLNPWDTGRSPGGSSGGSAVALAVGAVMVAVGSDTGGSIRIPAAYCGVCGLKPTWGSLSTQGVFPLAPTLDHPGPMARWPADLAIMFDVMRGLPARPPRSHDRDGAPARLRRLRLGVPDPVAPVRLQDGRLDLWSRALASLEHAGHRVVPIQALRGVRALEVFSVLQRAEARSVHEGRGFYPRRRGLYGSDVLRRLDAAGEIGFADYLEMTRERLLLAHELDSTFEAVDVIVSPVASTSPVLIGQDTVSVDGADTDFRATVMPFNVLQDLTGHPSCAVGTGQDLHGVPAGIQFTGPRGADHTVIALAAEFEDVSHAAWRATRATRSPRRTQPNECRRADAFPQRGGGQYPPP